MQVALYTRFSDKERQNATSIQDQVRRCLETAKRHGLEVKPALIFKDEGITGTDKGKEKRRGYLQLLDAIEAGEVRTIIVDELSRLTRDVEEAGRLMKLVQDYGLQIIAANGLDTRQTGWQTSFMGSLMMSCMEGEGIKHRAIRGMLGQLNRGYMIAQAPYGYRRVKDLDAKGAPIGTRWVIDDEKAQIVRQIFAWRHANMSGNEIAKRLNESGVALPMESRCITSGGWRPGNVFRLLNNSIYRGVFVWNGSTFTKAKANRKGEQVQTIEFARPECRLVSDEVWLACNPHHGAGSKRRVRGGGKQLFSGLVNCGDCSATLSVAGCGKSRSLYCPQCETLHRVGTRKEWMGYSSVSAARTALVAVVETLFNPANRAEFVKLLEGKLTKGPVAELAELKAEIEVQDARRKRAVELLLRPEVDPSDIQPELTQCKERLAFLKRRRDAVQAMFEKRDPAIVAAQLKVDPLALFFASIDGALPVYQVRAVLGRLMTDFRLVQRPAKGVSVFTIKLTPGVFVAHASGTKILDSSAFSFKVTARVGAARPAKWEATVEAMPG